MKPFTPSCEHLPRSLFLRHKLMLRSGSTNLSKKRLQHLFLLSSLGNWITHLVSMWLRVAMRSCHTPLNSPPKTLHASWCMTRTGQARTVMSKLTSRRRSGAFHFLVPILKTTLTSGLVAPRTWISPLSNRVLARAPFAAMAQKQAPPPCLCVLQTLIGPLKQTDKF